MPCADCSDQQLIITRLTNALSDQELKCQDLEKKLQRANLKNKARLVHYKDQFLDKTNLNESEIIENLLQKLDDSARQIEKLEENAKNQENLPEKAIQENIYSQILYKDAKIMDLSKLIDEKDKQIMDLQEAGKERDEVLKAKTKAIQILQHQLQKFTNKKFSDKSTDCDSEVPSSGQEDKYSPGGAVAFYKETSISKDDECSSFTTELTFNESITEPVKNIEKLNTRLSGLLEQVETMQKKVVNKQQKEDENLLVVDSSIVPVKKKREKKVKFDFTDKEKDGKIQELEEKLQRSELFCDDLREENEDLRFTIADLEKRLSDDDVNLNKKEQELDDLKQKIAKVESQLIDSKNQYNDHKINSLKFKAREASHLKELETELRNLKTENSDLQQKCLKAETENSNLKHQIDASEQNLNITKQELENLKDQAKIGFDEFKIQSENIILELEGEMEKLQTENANLQNEISILNSSLQDLKLENDEMMDEKENLLTDLSQLKEAIEISNEFIQFLEHEGTKMDRVGGLQDENFSSTEYRLKFKAYLTKMNVLQKENEKLEDEIIKLTDLLRNNEVYCKNLTNEISSLKKDSDNEKAQRSILEKSLKDIKLACDRTTSDSKSYLSKIEELQTLLDDKENELQSLISNQRCHDSQFSQLRRDFEKQSDEFSNLKKQFDQSSDEKSEIENELSKLWAQDAASKKAMSDMERECSKILREKQILEKSNEDLLKIIQDLKAKISDQEKMRFQDNDSNEENLKHQIDGFEKENLKLKRQVESLENHCQSLNVEMQNLKRDFLETNRSLVEERERNISLRDELQQKDARFMEMENSTETLLGIISGKETDLNQLHAKLEDLEFKLRRLEDEKLALTSQIDSKDNLLVDLSNELQNLEPKIQNLEHFCKVYKNEIRHLKESNRDLRFIFQKEMESLSNLNNLIRQNFEKLSILKNQQCSYEELQAYYVQLQNAYASLYKQYEDMTSATAVVQDQCTSLVTVDLNAEFSPTMQNLEQSFNNASPTVAQTGCYINGSTSVDQCSSIIENLIQLVQPTKLEHLANFTPAEKLTFVQNHVNKLILQNQTLQKDFSNSKHEIYGLNQHVEILCKELHSVEELYTNEKHAKENLAKTCDQLQDTEKLLEEEIRGLKILCKRLDEQWECKVNQESLTLHQEENFKVQQEEIFQILNEIHKSDNGNLIDQCKSVRQEFSTLQSLCKRLEDEKLELECKLQNPTLQQNVNVDHEAIRQILDQVHQSGQEIDLIDQCKAIVQEFSTLETLCKRLEGEKLDLECKLQQSLDRERNVTLHNEESVNVEKEEIRQILYEISGADVENLVEHCKIVAREFSTLQNFCKRLEDEKLELECKVQKAIESEKNSTLHRNDFSPEILQRHYQSLQSMKTQLSTRENDIKIFESQIVDFLNQKLWKIDEMIAQMTDVNAKMSKLTGESAILERQNLSLIEELDQTKEKLSKMEFDSRVKSQELENRDSKISTLHQEYSVKIQILNEQCKMLESVNNMSKNEDDSQRLLLESKDKDLQKWKNRYDDLEIKFNDQDSKLSTCKARIEELEDSIFEKKTRNALVQCSLNQDLELKNRDLMSQISNLEEKCSKNAEKFQQMTKFIDESKILREFKLENERLTMDIEKLKRENQVLNDGTVKIEGEFQLLKLEYQRQLDQVAQDAKSMQEENDRLLNLNQISNQNIEKYVQEIHDLKNQMSELRKICDNLQSDAQNSHLEREKGQKLNANLKKENSNLKDQCRRLDDRLKILEKDRKSENATSEKLKTATKDAKALIESLEKERATNNVRAKELLDLKAQLAFSERHLDDLRIKLLDSESSHRTIKALRQKLKSLSDEKERLFEDYSKLKSRLEEKPQIAVSEQMEKLEILETSAPSNGDREVETRSQSEEIALSPEHLSFQRDYGQSKSILVADPHLPTIGLNGALAYKSRRRTIHDRDVGRELL